MLIILRSLELLKIIVRFQKATVVFEVILIQIILSFRGIAKKRSMFDCFIYFLRYQMSRPDYY